MFLFAASVSANAKEVIQGEWKININESNGKADIYKSNLLLIPRTQCAFKIADIYFSQEELTIISIDEAAHNDNFGNGKRITISSELDSYTIKHNYYLYDNYILTDFTIESAEIFQSNYMAPVKTTGTAAFLPSDGNNRTLFIPFDNDKWIRYRSDNFGTTTTAFEVGAIYNAESNQGLIIGSVEHILWKTGVITKTTANNFLNSLEVFGGITAKYETSDNLPHGSVKGRLIKSPKIFIGFFNDWRKGLESYADVNAVFTPKLPWDSGKPFLWNSWGVIQTEINYPKARQVSTWIANNLQNNNFHNDGTVYIDLDSYWDNLQVDQREYFVQFCESNGQKAGIYWTPFVDWADRSSRQVEGSGGQYTYGDIYLYANGKKQYIAGAPAIDPTHPATKMRIDHYLNQFKNQGYKFIKLDFLTHGALEADYHYDPEVYTGIQAYNQGMQYIIDVLDSTMFINLSISPLFPANYAHSRRIACDAYTEAEYTLNSLTYGWWLDRVYSYNDADNVVFQNKNTYEGLNRSRVISSVITGIFCIGDDFSNNGNADAKEKATRFLTNKEINNVARQTKAFRPVKSANGDKAADMYYSSVGDTTYVAIFNTTAQRKYFEIDFLKLGMNNAVTYISHELWSDDKTERSESWQESVSRMDVKMLKIYPGKLTGIKTTTIMPLKLYPNPCTDNLIIESKELLKSISIYSITGVQAFKADNPAENIPLHNLRAGAYLLTAEFISGAKYTTRLIKK